MNILTFSNEMITGEADNLTHVCVDLQVYCPEPERSRIDVFDLLSDARHNFHVGCGNPRIKPLCFDQRRSKNEALILSE